jgi:hypothetical protein
MEKLKEINKDTIVEWIKDEIKKEYKKLTSKNVFDYVLKNIDDDLLFTHSFIYAIDEHYDFLLEDDRFKLLNKKKPLMTEIKDINGKLEGDTLHTYFYNRYFENL